MLFIKAIAKKFLKRNEDSENSFQLDAALSQLSHDIKNNFVAIRSLTGSIRNNLPNLERDAIETKLKTIDKMLDYASAHVELTRMRFSPVKNYISSPEFSILNCINDAIQNYPFPSQKCLSHITISMPEQDFNVFANRQIILHILSCLLKNVVHAIYRLEYAQTTIKLIKDAGCNQVCFHIPNTPLDEKNPFSLGLPERPGAGLKFIERIMITIDGSVAYKAESGDSFLITLLFPPNN